MPPSETNTVSLEDRLRPLSTELRTALRRSLESLPEALPDDRLEAIVTGGASVALLDREIVLAYAKAAPGSALTFAPEEIVEWAQLGAALKGKMPKSVGLAARYFDLTPHLLERMTYASLRLLGHFLKSVADRSVDHAIACLDAFPALADSLDAEGCYAFLDFADAVRVGSWIEAVACFQRGRELLANVEPFQQTPLLKLTAKVAHTPKLRAFKLFAEAAQAMSKVRTAYQGRLIELAEQIYPFSSTAAMVFLKNAPYLSERLDLEQLETWHRAGIETFIETGSGGDAYFALELRAAEEMIHTVSARIDLHGVANLLNLYMKALIGRNVLVKPVGALAEKGIGWVGEAGASTEGTTVYLPEHFESFETKQENFAAYKALATHQAGHIEFGSFAFDFDRDGRVFETRRPALEAARAASSEEESKPLTDMERFFDLFPDRELVGDLFRLVEDTRIDARLQDAYAGLRAISRKLKELELKNRPNTYFLALRQAFVENLLRVSLDGPVSAGWPKGLSRLLDDASALLLRVRAPKATVEDAAEATALLYDLASRVPNLPPGEGSYMDWMSIVELEEGTSLNRNQFEGISGREVAYETFAGVSFYGDFKPEMVQLLMQVREDQQNGNTDGMTPEQLRAFLEKSAEVSDKADLEKLADNIEKEAATIDIADASAEDLALLASTQKGALGSRTYHYNEWDFRAGDYRPRWCTLHEMPVEEGNSAFFEDTLKEHADLVKETQHYFELMRADPFVKIKRLEDGEDLDLDAAIEFIAQKRAGSGESAKVYWRRNKAEREVAVAVLLDMSSSTDARLEKQSWPPKRIIDLEKESIVLLSSALEVIGDTYGIFGFSGTGRHNVQYFQVKDFREALTDTVKRRIDGIGPVDGTRMGPAVRHTIEKLLAVEARTRILLLVSDGRPQDVDYGPAPGDREYAIHDTHNALLEARGKGITPFAITVDKEGNEYLGQMCGDIAYEILPDIELLPSRLPALYRMLTE